MIHMYVYVAKNYNNNKIYLHYASSCIKMLLSSTTDAEIIITKTATTIRTIRKIAAILVKVLSALFKTRTTIMMTTSRRRSRTINTKYTMNNCNRQQCHINNSSSNSNSSNHSSSKSPCIKGQWRENIEYRNSICKCLLQQPALLLLMLALILMLNGCVAKIALMPHTNHSGQTLYDASDNNHTTTTTTKTATKITEAMLQHCASSKLTAARIIDEALLLPLPLDTVMHVPLPMNRHWKQRLLLHLNFTTPLAITFSQHVERQIYFNRTTRLNVGTRIQQQQQQRQQHYHPQQHHHYSLVLPCALRGEYDVLMLQNTRNRSALNVEAHVVQPKAQWSLLSHVHRVNIRNQNRVRKRELIIKWDRSKFDFYAVHYCLVFNLKHHYRQFCNAVEDYINGLSNTDCLQRAPMDYIWGQAAQRIRKINAQETNVICTGSRTQQVLKGLSANSTYYLDIFGVHTRRHNLTFHMASTMVHYNRQHPHILRHNMLSVLKISEMQGTQVFSYKIPSTAIANNGLIKSDMVQLRYLILPCGGSEIDAKLLKRRKIIAKVTGIYRPTYIVLPALRGERYIIRFFPSNEDEILKANKVALAVSTTSVFSHLPELPENITVFEVRPRCKSTTIAWYHSPDNRPINYCIIVFNMSQRNRSYIDYTNYCMDFGKRVIKHRNFHSIRCFERNQPDNTTMPLDRHTIFNLLAGESYLIYVTANLAEGKPLPYQSLKVQISAYCANRIDADESREQNAYY